jgi:hypothetical protein
MTDSVKTDNKMADKMSIIEVPTGADEMLRLARAAHHFDHIIMIGVTENRNIGVYANIISPTALLILEHVVSRLQPEEVCNA